VNVALVHDWLNGMRGGEKVLEVFCELFPSADIFTLFYRPERVSERIRGMNVRVSFLQKFPGSANRYRSYLPLFPRAVESFDLSGYDLVVSTSHAVAKGARRRRGSFHFCYCFTPMRYAWFFSEDYFGKNRLKQAVLSPFLGYLRRWDRASSPRVDRFVAISRTVADRIYRAYGRQADVIFPPVDADFYAPGGRSGSYFLIVSALVPYKRVETAVAVFNRLGLPLKVAGSGPLEHRLRRLAGPGVEVMGWLPDEEIRELYRGCRALIFPGLEDFGIVPLEAQACGRPVIGLGRGGLTETTIPWGDPGEEAPTGIFYTRPSEEDLEKAVRDFLEHEGDFDPVRIRSHALKFDRSIFRGRIAAELKEYLPNHERKRE